ncbi:GspMb/PilO family protein [Janthinobacterium sp. AD80]|uniref:GspMb/PilO family protein n=1 Tax=Janthinobacterium sp. AD80 TaxID=1528773 RepID=UPI0011AF754C|nr:GspMb/PilO family protein [Janthinobacterium sp. AD80]
MYNVFFRKKSQFRLSGRQHWPWLVTGTVLCCATWLAISELPTQRADNKTAAAKVRMLEAQLRTQAADPVATQQNLAAQLAGFDSLSLVTADLQSLATQNGLLMSDASFKPAGDNQPDARIGRVEVNARIKGAYLPLKKTLAALLATHGGLALDSLSLRRARASDIVMDIDLRFTYFYRKPS